MAQHRSLRRGRPWLVPAVVVAVVALLLAVVVALGADSDEEAGPGDRGRPQDPATTAEDPADQDDAAQQQEQVEAPPATGDPLAQGPPTQVEGPQQPDAEQAEARDPEDLLAAGPVDAPVVLVVFSDYQCPFCAHWSHDTLPLMMEHAEAGDLRIEWRDVNVFGEVSERASRASYAAALQDSFWEYHEALYPEGQMRSEGELSEDALLALAVDLGLDGDQFTADMNSPETAAQIEENAQLGLDLGAYSTPSFLLGGEAIVGAQPTDIFTATFDAALAAAEGT